MYTNVYFRLQRKDNWPVTEKLEVPVHKRSRLFGLGGGNLKKLTAVTGVQVYSNLIKGQSKISIET